MDHADQLDVIVAEDAARPGIWNGPTGRGRPKQPGSGCTGKHGRNVRGWVNAGAGGWSCRCF